MFLKASMIFQLHFREKNILQSWIQLGNNYSLQKHIAPWDQLGVKCYNSVADPVAILVQLTSTSWSLPLNCTDCKLAAVQREKDLTLEDEKPIKFSNEINKTLISFRNENVPLIQKVKQAYIGNLTFSLIPLVNQVSQILYQKKNLCISICLNSIQLSTDIKFVIQAILLNQAIYRIFNRSSSPIHLNTAPDCSI